ncbi:MAG: phasin family protein [Gammaproteobacteria bacterium]
MSEVLFDKTLVQTEVFVAPLLKANKLAVANFERVVNYQLSALQYYVDLSLAQLRAAAEIDSPQKLYSFFNKQMETATSVRQRFVEDAKALTEISNDIKEDFTKLAEDSAKEFAKNTKPVAKKAA